MEIAIIRSHIKRTFYLLSITLIHALAAAQDITPYKFKDHPYEVVYDIPVSSRFTVARPEVDAPDIVYYMTTPKDQKQYPIALVCGGSSHRNTIGTIIYFHRYLLQEFMDLGCAVMTVEQWGVDGNNIDEDAFMEHYTRTQRLKDHCTVINHLRSHPIVGWDGTFILLGASEGGPLVTSLTELYPECLRATINWCGAGDKLWYDELWEYFNVMQQDGPWWFKTLWYIPNWLLPLSWRLPKTRQAYDALIQQATDDPCVDKEFGGMTYLYHADAQRYPLPDYTKIKTPFLAVCGTQDPLITSCDMFVHKAQNVGAPITYLRVEGMDHYVRKRPDIVEQSFIWLKNILAR